MAKKIVQTTIDGSIITLSVAGHEGTISLDTNELSDEIRGTALMHGIKQKISDGAALPKVDGKSASPSDKFANMQSIADQLIAGDWSKRSGDGTGTPAGIIYLAYHRWAEEMAAEKGATITAEKSREVYDRMSRSEQLNLRNHERIGEIIDEIKMERGTASNVDTDELLSELFD